MRRLSSSVLMTQSKEIKETNRRQRESLVLVCHPLFLFCSRLSSGNLDPGLDLPHRLDNLEEGQTERQWMVRTTSREERGTLSPMSTMALAPRLQNQSHQSRGERQSRSSKHRKLEKEQPVHLQSMRDVKKGSKYALEDGSSNLMLSSPSL